MNPSDRGMMESIAAFRVLMSKDMDSREYIEQFSNIDTVDVKNNNSETMTIEAAIRKGLKEETKIEVEHLLQKQTALEIIEQYIVPALDEVGKLYEAQKIFLPQLIKSAEAAKAGFERLQKECKKTD